MYVNLIAWGPGYGVGVAATAEIRYLAYLHLVRPSSPKGSLSTSRAQNVVASPKIQNYSLFSQSLLPVFAPCDGALSLVYAHVAVCGNIIGDVGTHSDVRPHIYELVIAGVELLRCDDGV